MEIWAAALARDAIRDLVARYSLFGDLGRSADVANLFATDGTLEIADTGGRELFTGRAEIEAFLERVKAQWTAEVRVSGISGRVFHSVGTHVIDLVDEDHATGQAYVSMIRLSGLAEWGRYRDRYVREDNGWLIAARTAFVEGRVQGASLADGDARPVTAQGES
jgi:hypothetical protein